MPAEPLHPVASALRILFISLEFRAGTFSGNGVYACAQVRALAAAGHQVFVVSAAPAHAAKPEDDLGAHRIVEVPVSSWHRLDAGAPWREFAAGAADSAVAAAVATFAPQYVYGVDWSALAAVRALAPYTRGAPYVYLNYRVFCRTAAGEDLELVRGLESAAMAEALLTVALSRSDADYLVRHVAAAAAAEGAEEGAAAKASEAGLEGAAAVPESAATDAAGRQQPAAVASAAAAGAGAGAAAAANGNGNGVHKACPAVASAANGSGGAHGPAHGAGTCAAPYAASTPASHRPKVLLPALREDVRQLQPPPALQRLADALQTSSSAPAVAAVAAVADREQGTHQQQQHSPEGLAAAVAAAEAEVAARPYLACVVRLSPEKEPERFVEVVEAMAARRLLQRLGVRPLLLGAANDEYAQALKARLRAAAPDAQVLESFVGPAQLADLYRATRLNFHPATYDAYGMTIVEAASQGAPSVVHDGGGAVGATDLLRGRAAAATASAAASAATAGAAAAAAAGANGGGSASESGGSGGSGGGGGGGGGEEVFLLDLTAPSEVVAEAVAALWGDVPRLAAVAARALARARSWDEAANAAQLVGLVAEVEAEVLTGGKGATGRTAWGQCRRG